MSADYQVIPSTGEFGQAGARMFTALLAQTSSPLLLIALFRTDTDAQLPDCRRFRKHAWRVAADAPSSGGPVDRRTVSCPRCCTAVELRADGQHRLFPGPT